MLQNKIIGACQLKIKNFQLQGKGLDFLEKQSDQYDIEKRKGKELLKIWDCYQKLRK